MISPDDASCCAFRKTSYHNSHEVDSDNEKVVVIYFRFLLSSWSFPRALNPLSINACSLFRSRVERLPTSWRNAAMKDSPLYSRRRRSKTGSISPVGSTDLIKSDGGQFEFTKAWTMSLLGRLCTSSRPTASLHRIEA